GGGEVVRPDLGEVALVGEVEGRPDVSGDHGFFHDVFSRLGFLGAAAAAASSIRIFFWILPTAVFGSSARNSYWVGSSILESRPCRNLPSASAVSTWPSFSATTAFTVWPR